MMKFLFRFLVILAKARIQIIKRIDSNLRWSDKWILQSSCNIAIVTTILLPLPALASPAKLNIQETKSDYGYSIWLVEDHSLPVINTEIAFRNAGSAYSGEDKAGLAFMLSQILGEGAGELNSIEFNNQLESNAIELGFSVSRDNFYASMKTLSANKEKAFNLMGMALAAPPITPPTIKRVREQIIDNITSSMENPSYIAAIEWNKQYYGSHPYSLPVRGTKSTVKNITQGDLINYAKGKLQLSNMIVTVVGDTTPKEILRLIDSSISKLKINKNSKNGVALPKFNNFPKGKTIKITKSVPQSVAIFGFKAPYYLDEDFFAAYILNYTFGGGSFESRLMKEIREKHGLAYSVNTYISSMEFASVIKGSVGTRSEEMTRSINILREEVDKLHKDGITKEELLAAKNYLKGSFPLRIDSNRRLANYLQFMKLENLGIDFIEKRNSYLSAVTLDDVKKAAQKYLNNNNLFIVVAGGESKLLHSPTE